MLTTGGITFNSINNSISQVTSRREADLQNTINNLGDSPSTGDLLGLQQHLLGLANHLIGRRT